MFKELRRFVAGTRIMLAAVLPNHRCPWCRKKHAGADHMRDEVAQRGLLP